MQRKKTFDSFRRCKVVILSVLMSFCMTAAFAQSGAVKGKVLDELGEPIIGANIVEKGTTNGTITDIDGNYTLTLNDLKKAVLQFSFIGYNTLEEGVKGRNKVDVKLAPSVVNLGEVVAIGYGTQTRKEITGSVANVSEENFNKGVNRDASDLLQGKVAGLQITSGSGDVTRSSQIRLRGTSTLQNDQGPMIVIDGVPGGDMSTVSPSDIESISVLKDASSAAIYGSRAAGGVILITTKRGSGAKTQINYDGYVTMDKVANKPDMLNASEWRDVNKQLGSDISQYDKYNADTDWFGALLRTGISQNHALSLSGGSSKSNYRASYTYLDRKGIARDNWMKRHSFRFQFQQRAINDRLRIGLTGAATLTDMQATFADYFIAAYNNVPVVPIYNEDGSYFTGNDNAYNQGNMVKAQDENYKLFKNNYFYGQGDVQFEVIEGLNVKANLYKSRYTSDYSQWESPDNALGGGAGNSLGDSSNGYAKRRNFVWDRELMEWTADYNKSFGAEEKHKLNALLGYSWETNGYQSQESLATQFSVASMGANSIQAGNDLKIGNVTSSKNDYKLISFFARAHYSYDERYMITATMRRDGSSKFGSNYRYGNFPSVSVGWNIAEEDFVKNSVSWLDQLKLRGGYGVLGNQEIDNYQYVSVVTTGINYPDGKSGLIQGAFPKTFANPDIKWEETAMTNVGIDASLLNGNLDFSFEFFDKRTSDILRKVTLPDQVGGLDGPIRNIGEVSNKGFELNMGYRNNIGDFRYEVNGNMTFIKNKIVSLKGQTIIDGMFILEEGKPIDSYYMLHAIGIFQSEEEIKNSPYQTAATKPGYLKFEDTNGDGKITEDDRQIRGGVIPKITYGFNINLGYKDWDLGAFFQGVTDVYTYGDRIGATPLWFGCGLPEQWLTDAWTPERGTSATLPILTTYEGCLNENFRTNDFWLRNASYLRLKNLQLSYNVPASFLKSGVVKRLKVFVNAQNLFTFSPMKDFDPEKNLKGSNWYAYPSVRTYTAGVNVTF